MIVGLFLADRT